MAFRSVRRRLIAITLGLLGLAYVGLATVVEEGEIQQQRTDRRGDARSGQVQRLTGDELMDVVRRLSSPEFEGRKTDTAGNERARTVIAERMTAAGLLPLGTENTFNSPFRFTHTSIKGVVMRGESMNAAYDGSNLVGLCRGTGAPDQGVMVISAHYDHLGIRQGVLYPGADDNASGVSAILALARHCVQHPWTHDAIFVAFDAEELGLQGARAFVKSPPVPVSRLAVNINLDMVSRSDKGELFVAGTHHRPGLKRVLDPVAASAPVVLLFGHDKPLARAGRVDDWTMQSDHGAFHTAGIPFVYFGVEDHADYHQPSDTADKIDPDFFRRAAETVLDTVTALDRALPALRQ